MAVERIDAQIQGLISEAQLQSQKVIAKDDDAEAARKAAEKKIEIRKEEKKQAAVKQSVVQRETFQKQNAVEQRLRQIMSGGAGPEAQQALNGWENNPQIQAKLTEAQKQLFRESMAKDPVRTTDAANALNRLVQQKGFDKAVTTAPQMGTLHEGLLQNPKSEKSFSDMLQSRFMQAKNADAQSKNQFLRFGLQQANKQQLDAIKRAGDMLGALTGQNINRSGQAAALKMVERNPSSEKATGNLDAFVKNESVQKLPSFARGKATELLAKANGDATVKTGFEQLVANEKFRNQAPQNKGRFFSTIGTGRPSEFRSLTDKSLSALQSSNFPSRSSQVSKFLNKMAAKIQQGGSDNVDVEELLKEAKAPPMPQAPQLESIDGLSAEESLQVTARNRAKIMQYYSQVQKVYDQSEKKLVSAKYMEDINALGTLRQAPSLSLALVSEADRALISEKESSLQARLDSLRTMHRQRSRELRTKRMPPAKRRAKVAERRLVGKQPRYFSPNTGRTSATATFVQAATAGGQAAGGLSTTPQRAQLARNVNIDAQVASAVSQLSNGALTPEKAGQVARAIAQQVAQQVTAQITQQLLGGVQKPVVSETSSAPVSETKTNQVGRVDGWGIQRTFERDLGAVRPAVVKAPESNTAVVHHEPAKEEVYTGKMLVKDPSTVRDLAGLFESPWKELNKSEKALLKNLGWSQQHWDTKNNVGAQWPSLMMTGYVNLNPTQRESVRKLGLSPHDWDTRVQALKMSKNA